MTSQEHGEQVYTSEHQVLRQEDCRNIANALKECISVDWQFLAQVHFEIRRGKIEDIKSDANSRDDKILSMVDAWTESNGENATLSAVYEILNKAKLVGIRQHLQHYYKDDQGKEDFAKNNKEWREFCNKFVHCEEIHDDERWEKIELELDFTCRLKEEEKAQIKEMQRLDFLNKWREKCGHEQASVENLKTALKKGHLRRVIYRLSTGQSTALSPFLVNILEREWDLLFSKLSENILQRVADEFGMELDKEQIFDRLMEERNDGFYRFMKMLLRELSKEAFHQSFSDETQALFLHMQSAVFPKDENFFPSGEYDQSKSIFWEKRFLMLCGRSGCGKSELIRALTEDFLAEYPFSFVLPFNCKTHHSIGESVQAFRDVLLKANVCKDGRAFVRNLVADMKASNLHVFLIFEHLSADSLRFPDLIELIREVSKYNNAYAVATSRQLNFNSGYFHPTSMHGFTETEAHEFLLSNGDNESDETAAVQDIIARSGCLPLDLAKIKACCEELAQGSFVNYVEYLNEEQGKEMVQRFYSQWMRRRCERLPGVNRDTDEFSRTVLGLVSRVERLEESETENKEENERLKRKVEELEAKLNNENTMRRQLKQQIDKVQKELKVLEDREKLNEVREERWKKTEELWREEKRQLLQNEQQRRIELEEMRKTLAKKDEMISQMQVEMEAFKKQLSERETRQVETVCTPPTTRD